MTNPTQTADLDATIALLKNNLASIDPEAAIANIEAWQQQLMGTEIAETLGELKLAIDGGIRSGEIPSILSDLGNQTASAAGSQEGSSASKLQELGQLLSNAIK
ncbi:MAG: hypothetical protein MUC48_11040 [Leptolyngbya sp. Prado105]|nr:hypothetical protein [Leptolyngbya sp. Prado105]